jgi:glycosyltransferase involved in cell wall biosynthesis
MNSQIDKHFVSVIIPTINRESLSRVLEALNKQAREPDEVIFMEDRDHLGVSIMRNEGIEKSRGDLIAFLDDVNVPEKDWLETFINEIDRYQADGVSSNYIEEDPFLNEVRVRRKFPEVPVVNPDGFFWNRRQLYVPKSLFD